VEISPSQDEYDIVDYLQLKRDSKSSGVELWSFHLPFMPFETIDISALSREVRENSVKRDSELIKMASDIGVTKYVIHASGEPINDTERGERMKRAKESLFSLAETAVKNGGTLAVEDLPRTCLGRNSEEILELIGAHESLRVCFDTNHLLSEPITDFIKNVGDKIITTHVSDYDFIDEKHWLPGEGSINWQELYSALKDTGYNGVWLYELGFRAPRSRPRERDLTPADFALNAKEIFGGLPLTLIK